MNSLVVIIPVYKVCPLMAARYPVSMNGARNCERQGTQKHFKNAHPGVECHDGVNCIPCKAYHAMALEETRAPTPRELIVWHHQGWNAKTTATT